MRVRLSIALFVCLAASRPAAADATLFRLFLLDGSSVVSYGEMARVRDQVVFSLPVGGTPADPRLHAVSLASSLVDWPRTDRYATSARYLTYFISGRAEADYQRLTIDVAAVLNQIAQSSDRAAAIGIADQARRVLIDWPRTHFGYRQQEVRDIVILLDQAISRLRGATTFELSLFASAEPIALEPLAAMPPAWEQLDQIFRILSLTTSGRDRVALILSALALLADAGAGIDGSAAQGFRRSLEGQLRGEAAVDARYARLTERVVAEASRAAAGARIADVERVLDHLTRQDAKLGRRRPDVIQAARTAVQGQLAAARQLRLLQDQWRVRQRVSRDYQRTVKSQLAQLVKAQPALEAIRRLQGPSPRQVLELQGRLRGGADRLQRVPTPDYLRSTHELLVNAWRFAETAARTRYAAAASGSVATAWEASSAAAGALLMLSRAQLELRVLLEPPKLQ